MSWKTHLSTNPISIFSLSFFYNLHVLSNLVLYSLFSLSASNPLFLPFYNLYVLCSPVRDFLLGRLVPGCKRIRTNCIFYLFTLADSNCEPFPIKCSGKRKYHYSIFRISQYLLIIYGEVNTCRVLGDFPQEFWNVNTESEGEKYVLQHGTDRKHNSDEFKRGEETHWLTPG